MAEEEQVIRFSETRTLIDEQFKIRAQSAPWWGGVELYGITEWMGEKWVLEDVILRQRTPDMLTTVPPTIKLSNQAAQVLMDDLWMSGIRPAEKRDIGPSLKATQEHLADMQKIAFRLLDDKLA